MKMLKRALLIAFALFLLAPPSPASAQTLTLTGAVHDELGRVMAGAEVYLFAAEPVVSRLLRLATGAEEPRPRLSAKSGAEGRFSFEVPEPGMWRVEVRAEGRVPVAQALEPLLEPQELAAAVLRPDVGATVTVRDLEGRPIEGARVELMAIWGRTELWGIGWRAAERRGLTQAQGTVRLPAATNEMLGVQAEARGYLPAQRYELDRSVTEVALAGAVKRLVEIVDEAGKPVAGVLVMTEESSAALMTGEDGRCEVEVQTQGSTGFRFLAMDGRVGRGDVRPPNRGERRPPSFKLAPPRRLKGRVHLGESADPAAGALVWSDFDPATFTLAGHDGSFELELWGGSPRLFVKAAKAGYFAASTGLAELERSREPLVLEPKTAIYGRVVDETGVPLDGAQAALTRQGSFSARSFGRGDASEARTTGADGRFQLAAVANELYWLEVTLDGFVRWEKEVSPGKKALRVVMSRGRAVTGRVVGADDQPLSGARLTLVKAATAQQGFSRFSRGRRAPEAPAAASADEQGKFRFDRVGAGTYHVDAVADGHAPFRLLAVEIPAGSGQVELGVLRLEGGASLTGRVVDSAGAPVAGATLNIEGRAWQPGEDGANSDERALMRRMELMRRMQRLGTPGTAAPEASPEEIRSDAEGLFTLDGLAEGERVTVVAEREGYAPARAQAVEVPSPEPLLLVLERRSSIAGVVVDESGKPVAGAMVTAARSVADQQGMMVRMSRRYSEGDARPTDESGRFEHQDVTPGRVKVEAQAEGYLAYNQWVEVPPGARVEGLRLVLARGATVEGRVTTADGAPVAMAFITATDSDRMYSVSTSSETDEDGRYKLTGVATGERTFECHVMMMANRSRVRQRLVVAPGTNRLDFVLEDESGFTVSGRVIDGAGAPVAGAMVMLQGSNRMASNNDSSHADGSFRIDNVTDGIYSVRAFKDGLAMVDPELRIEIAGRAIDGLVVELFAGGRIDGRVVGLEPRHFPGVSVSVSGGGMRAGFGSVGVDAEGAFSLSNLLAGRHTVTAQDAVGGRSVEAVVVLAEGEESAVVEIDFAAGLTLSGWVKVGEWPAAGANLVVTGLDVSANATARTNHQGRFEVAGLDAGLYRVAISLAGTSTAHQEEIELMSDDERTFELELGGVSGRVTDAVSGRPVPGAQVILLSAEAGVATVETGRDSQVSDSQGVFDLGEVAAGSYRLRAVKGGYITRDHELEVRPGESNSVELELSQAAALVLALSSALGGAPDWIQVAALDGQGQRVLYDNVYTDQDGLGRITRLPPGRFTLLVGTFSTAFVEVEANLPGPPVPVHLPLGTSLVVEVPALEGESTLAKASLLDAAGRPFRSAARGDVQIEWPVAGGSARIPGVRPGPWRLVVTAPDGRTWQTELVAPAEGGTLTVQAE